MSIVKNEDYTVFCDATGCHQHSSVDSTDYAPLEWALLSVRDSSDWYLCPKHLKAVLTVITEEPK